MASVADGCCDRRFSIATEVAEMALDQLTEVGVTLGIWAATLGRSDI